MAAGLFYRLFLDAVSDARRNLTLFALLPGQPHDATNFDPVAAIVRLRFIDNEACSTA